MTKRRDYPKSDLEALQGACAAYWYDRQWRAWGAAYYLASGDQVGEAEWLYSRDDAIGAAETIAAKHRCQVVKLGISG